MKLFKPLLLATSAAGLLFLGACSGSGNQASAPANNSAASNSPAASPSTAAAPANDESQRKSGGGMAVESGPYHLELMPAKEGNETHLDLLLQKGDNHEAIPNAKVTAQVQLPDGSQKSVDMTYDAAEKHYTAKLPSAAAGEYKVAVQSDIGGEKVNARYTFKQ
ncbi:hypothetical protein LEP3755_63570 (plasmid) [Leptolyngbya sp. NIES-3755]|nr:hypothetical protein LEP3755_63570 [Leptolyngbya sp. NIES-3755]